MSDRIRAFLFGSDRLITILIFMICMVAGAYACGHKFGMHEDEFYSYYSSNRTVGFIAEGTVGRDVMYDELTVLPGEGYNFALVKEVQSWDVHPPVYYFVLHFICSLTQGVFSPWQGLSINLICLAIALFLMKELGKLCLPDDPFAVNAAILVWGLSPALLSGVVFIRMYMLLTVWILAVTILHLRFIRESADPAPGISENSVSQFNPGEIVRGDGKLVRFFVPLWILTFLGFMTHYYFLIWLVFLGTAWNICLLIRSVKKAPASSQEENSRARRLWEHIRIPVIYVLTELSCAAACYLFYPAFPAQMFRGQRGAQATGNFFDLSNTWERITFYASKINHLGFGGGLWWLIGLIAVLYLLRSDKMYLKRRYKVEIPEPEEWIDAEMAEKTAPTDNLDMSDPDDMIEDMTQTEYALEDDMEDYVTDKAVTSVANKDLCGRDILLIMTVAFIGYFLVVSKTALMLGDSSIRYHMPVLGVFYILLMALMIKASPFEGAGRYLEIILPLVIMVMNVTCDLTGHVCFLYPENEEKMKMLSEYKDTDVYYVYPDGQSWIMWAEGTQLLEFDEVTYLSSSELKDMSAGGSSDMILYIDSGEDTGSVLERFGSGFDDGPEVRFLFSDDYTVTYLLAGK